MITVTSRHWLAIEACAKAVHAKLGAGQTFETYMDALETEFKANGVEYTRNAPIPVYYNGKRISKDYTADFLCYGALIIKVYAKSNIQIRNREQMRCILDTTNCYAAYIEVLGGEKYRSSRVFRRSDEAVKQILRGEGIEV
ncbi:MAG: hypothetical protein Ta2B_25270 [Termitinemataceae bacterium]|nr:MAG: hypothetical protein Ta2B_25270 [Termitinemataceae bacterium]